MATKWAKQYQSKRWHKLRRDGKVTLCGRQSIPTKQADSPPWHLACVSCLLIIDNQKEKSS